MNAMLNVMYPKYYYKNSNESCIFADLKQTWPKNFLPAPFFESFAGSLEKGFKNGAAKKNF